MFTNKREQVTRTVSNKWQRVWPQELDIVARKLERIIRKVESQQQQLEVTKGTESSHEKKVLERWLHAFGAMGAKYTFVLY